MHLGLLVSLLSLLVGLWSENQVHDQKRPESALMESDTDATGILLQHRFKYIKGDAKRSAALEEEQKRFLRQYGLPTGAFARLEDHRMRELDRLYSLTLKKLENHPYRDLYRQIGAQVLVLYYCTSSSAQEASLRGPHNKLIIYLKEFKAAQGVNLGLIYTCFSRFRYHNSPQEVCKHLKEFLPYCERLLAEEKASFMDTSEKAVLGANESDKSVSELINITLNRDQDYLNKLRTMGRALNCSN